MEFIETPTFTRLVLELLAYPKNVKDDLTRDEIKQLKRLIAEFQS